MKAENLRRRSAMSKILAPRLKPYFRETAVEGKAGPVAIGE